ncbi:prolyl oligopeptidase family serine peptidase [Novosphingopyxis sp.]|uniref:prolyl oligopeptidase family serine peptidase n=1 Tax=Novosphingopyxis sp. TaxID=2709690 RepID=UPI003B599B8C
MRYLLSLAIAAVGPFAATSSPAAAQATGAAEAADPNLYLEDIHGEQALAKVGRWNERTLATLEAEPDFDSYRERALDLLQDDRQIANPDQVIGDRVLNLRRDKANPRGLWRIASLGSFMSGEPEWRTLIDVDALGKSEGKSWVWKGADCLAPDYTRCMVALSDGGGDAVLEREFDIPAGAFVEGGFAVPTAKTRLSWAGPDALYVGTDFGEGSLTSSGYPRIVKLWKRGAPLSAATEIAAVPTEYVGTGVAMLEDGAMRYPLLGKEVDFYHTDRSHIAPDGRLIASPLPQDAEVNAVLDGQLFATLQSDWNGIPAGAVVAYSIPEVLAGRDPRVERVFVPTDSQAVEQVGSGKSVLWVKLLDDVSGKLLALTRGADGNWSQQAIALPESSTVTLNATADDSDLAFVTVEGFLTPPTLDAVRPGAVPVEVDALPARFDASTMDVEQRFAASKDGTRIPYFLVRKKGRSGAVPALIHAYGGFNLAQTPTYLVGQPYRSGPAGLFWVEEGNAFVLANIRGGGEYGPRWHQETMREKHQNAFDDLAAVAEDLVRTGVSTKGAIAVSGRSNGGLLTSAAIEQRPDLYGAAVIGSPLTDMKRYSHLLAGASWIGEYGDPDKPADWAFIREYSPYQNLKPGVQYPTPFIYTSTEDDRVHPGHARKYAAKLETYDDPFYYYEDPEGGHAAGADRIADAQRAALVTVYLNKVLAQRAAR